MGSLHKPIRLLSGSSKRAFETDVAKVFKDWLKAYSIFTPNSLGVSVDFDVDPLLSSGEVLYFANYDLFVELSGDILSEFGGCGEKLVNLTDTARTEVSNHIISDLISKLLKREVALEQAGKLQHEGCKPVEYCRYSRVVAILGRPERLKITITLNNGLLPLTEQRSPAKAKSLSLDIFSSERCTMKVELGHVLSSLRTLSQLSVGDVLLLEHKLGGSLTLKGSKAYYKKVQLARKGNRKAVIVN